MKEKLNVLYNEDSRRSKERFTREEIINVGPTAVRNTICGDSTYWVAYKCTYILTCLGSKIFWRPAAIAQATYKNKRIYGDIGRFTPELIKCFHLDWIDSSRWVLPILSRRKDLWKCVLSGKITNPEQLCKYYSKKYFGGVYSYRTLRDCYCAPGTDAILRLYDFMYYTTNPEESLKRYIGSLEPRMLPLLRDTLYYCKILNTRMDCRWSERRLREEHQKQITMVNRHRIESIPEKAIAMPYERDGLSLILSARECFLEGEIMHNCIYSCYWSKVVRGEYLIAKGNINGQHIHLGIWVNKEDLTIDQIHTIYNGSVSNEIYNICLAWVANHIAGLRTVVSQIIGNTDIDKIYPSVQLIPQQRYNEDIEIPF